MSRVAKKPIQMPKGVGRPPSHQGGGGLIYGVR